MNALRRFYQCTKTSEIKTKRQWLMGNKNANELINTGELVHVCKTETGGWLLASDRPTGAERASRTRASKKASGKVAVNVWVDPANRPRVHAFVKYMEEEE